MSRCTFEEKLDIVTKAKNGKPIQRIIPEHPIREGMILELGHKYDRYKDAEVFADGQLRTAPD